MSNVTRFRPEAALPGVDDPYDPDHRPAGREEIARFASRFAREAVAGLVLELRASSGRTRIAAAQAILALALDGPEVPELIPVNVNDPAAMAALLEGEEVEMWLRQFGFERLSPERRRRREMLKPERIA